MDSPGQRFWAWSLQAYGRRGIEAALIDLQDRLGLDVNILLFACWTAATGREPLTVTECMRLIDGTRAWRSNVVEPLRAVRRHLKGAHGITGAVELREKVAALELDAEYAAQLEIARLAGEHGTLRAPAQNQVDAALAGLDACLAAAAVVPSDRDRARLASLARDCLCAAGAGSSAVE